MSRLAARPALVLILLPLLWQLGCGASSSSRTASNSDPRAQMDASEANPERDDPSLTPVTLQLNWFPEAEHGGYYAALAHGYYRDAGLSVKILPGGPDAPVVQQVARGTVNFGVVNGDNVLFGRAQDAPIVAVMAPLQISPRCILVHESSGIRNFDDLRNITLAVSSSNAFTQFLRRELQLDKKNVKIVPYAGNVAQFLRDKNYAQQGYVFSEPFVARKSGGDPRVLMLSELGFNPYTSTLFTNDETVRNNPELVQKMVAASVRGWQKYLQSPDKTNALIHKLNPQMDLDILAYGAKTLEPLVFDSVAEQEGVGTMSHARWQKLADQLVESKQMSPSGVDVRGAYDTRFVPRCGRAAAGKHADQIDCQAMGQHHHHPHGLDREAVKNGRASGRSAWPGPWASRSRTCSPRSSAATWPIRSRCWPTPDICFPTPRRSA